MHVTQASPKPPPAPVADSHFVTSDKSTDMETAALWHQRLGHVNMGTLNQLVQHAKVAGVRTPAYLFCKACGSTCEICVMEKHNGSPFRSKTERVTTPCHELHSDICGPYPIRSIGGGLYVVTLLCAATGYLEAKVTSCRLD